MSNFKPRTEHDLPKSVLFTFPLLLEVLLKDPSNKHFMASTSTVFTLPLCRYSLVCLQSTQLSDLFLDVDEF